MIYPFPKGLLIAIEGVDGAGKTTLAALLAQMFGERGIACAFSKEPTANRWGMELRRSAKTGRLSLERELELLTLDRKDHVERTISPMLKAGGVVLLDRYYWSTAAYQGPRGANVEDIIQSQESFAPKPDIVFLLDLSPEAGLGRVRARGDKPNEFEVSEELEKSRAVFLELIKTQTNGVLLDAGESVDEVWHKALSQVVNWQARQLTGDKEAVQANLKEIFGEARVDSVLED